MIYFGSVGFSSTFATVSDKKKIKDTHESVKIRKEVVSMVREDKKKTNVSISGFFELAALEKLKKPK